MIIKVHSAYKTFLTFLGSRDTIGNIKSVLFTCCCHEKCNQQKSVFHFACVRVYLGPSSETSWIVKCVHNLTQKGGTYSPLIQKRKQRRTFNTSRLPNQSWRALTTFCYRLSIHERNEMRWMFWLISFLCVYLCWGICMGVFKRIFLFNEMFTHLFLGD